MNTPSTPKATESRSSEPQSLSPLPAPAVSAALTLRLMLTAVTVAFAWILLPFFGTILWGSIIALMFAPLYRWLLPRMNHRHTRAALVTMGAALMVVVLPAVLVLISLAREATQMYSRIQSGEVNPALMLRGLFDALPDGLMGLLRRFGLGNFDQVQRKFNALLSQGSELIATHTFNLGQDAFTLVVSVFITLYLAFFLTRDGASIVRSVRMAIPLPPDHKQELLERFGTVLRATVKGNLVVALVQGMLGGLAFWVLEVNGALLWAVLMAALSLLPAVGAGLVWLPVALYLFAVGDVWQGSALVAYGVLIIGLADNVLRPLLVGKDTGMPDYLVLITTLGGIAVMGINGFVVGPTIAAMFVAVWHIQTTTRPLMPPHKPSSVQTTPEPQPPVDPPAP
ncbi:MAG: AI-2E family transporter [Hydrogenophaga sp.]|uniref:AI-2E family transporter n=1 Tax=Hydrogenophaga sp. TaxID=1904254 RepID=UPI00262AF037|nr:AI-2E family transporter [Hydrogenophaga sp.]MDM7942038.1 AI-2E family transporter [Hydrogenophaga sp.]